MHWIVVGILIGVGVMLAPLIVGGLILAWEWICLAAAAALAVWAALIILPDQ